MVFRDPTRPGADRNHPVAASPLPTEAREHGTASTGWDVYMTHSLMLPMLGDQPPEPLRRFAHGCMHPDPRTRPDAVDLLTEFDDLLDRLYGRRRFRPFSTTPTKGQ